MVDCHVFFVEPPSTCQFESFKDAEWRVKGDDNDGSGDGDGGGVGDSDGGGTDNNQIKLQKWRPLQLGAAATAMVAASAKAMGWAQTTINLSYRNGGSCS